MFGFNLYGLMIGLGMMVGVSVVEYVQKRLGKIDNKYLTFKIDNMLIWLIVPAIVGARAYHVIDLWDYYSTNLSKVVMIWEGGLGIYGAMIGGVIGIFGYILFLKKKNSGKFGEETIDSMLLQILDLVVFGLVVGQIFGRMGNYFNQELYGLPTTLPWGITIDVEHRVYGYESYSTFHPLFLYEMALNIVLLVWLFCKVSKLSSKMEEKSKKSSYLGWWFANYVIGYGLIRFVLEYLRIDPWRLAIFTTAQWVSIGMISLGWIIILKLKRNNRGSIIEL